MIRVCLAAVFALAALPLAAHPWEPFTALALEAETSALVTGGLAGEVQWRDLKTGEVLSRWGVPGRGPVVGLHPLRGENAVVATFSDGSSFLLRPSLADPVARPVPDSLSTEESRRWRTQGPSMSGVRADQGGNRAIGSPDGQIRVLLAVGGPEVVWKAHKAAVTGLQWSADGTVLYSCSFDGSLAIWVARTGELKSQL